MRVTSQAVDSVVISPCLLVKLIKRLKKLCGVSMYGGGLGFEFCCVESMIAVVSSISCREGAKCGCCVKVCCCARTKCKLWCRSVVIPNCVEAS